MLEKIMNLVKGQVAGTVDGIAGIPENKKEATVETTAHSLLDGLKQYATPENISSLTSILGGGAKKAAPPATGGMTAKIESMVASALTSKVGLNPSVAQKVATTVIPAVMSLLQKKSGESGSGFDIGSLLGGLTGGKSAGTGPASAGGMMDLLGNILGKK